MDQQNKSDNDIMNPQVPAEEAEQAAIVPAESEKDAEFAEAVARANEILGDDEDEAPTEHVPTEFEKKMAAIPENKWRIYQIIAGIAIGLFTVFALFGGEDSSFMFIIALCLALLGPNQFEKSANRKIFQARYALIVTIAVGLVVMLIYYGATGKLSNPGV